MAVGFVHYTLGHIACGVIEVLKVQVPWVGYG